MMYLESPALRLSGPDGYGYGPGCGGNDGNFIVLQERAYRNMRKCRKEERSGNMPLKSLATASPVSIHVGNSFDALFDAEDSYNNVQQQAITAAFKSASTRSKKRRKVGMPLRCSSYPQRLKKTTYYRCRCLMGDGRIRDLRDTSITVCTPQRAMDPQI